MYGFVKVFIAILILCPDFKGIYAQDAVLASGGEASGQGGAVSYSIGQAAYANFQSSSGQVSLGVQQIYLTIMVANEEPEPEISISLHPNPVQSGLQLTLASLVSEATIGKYTYRLIDLSGKPILEGVTQSEVTPIAVDNLAEGIYFLEVNLNHKSIKTFKVIKTN